MFTQERSWPVTTTLPSTTGVDKYTGTTEDDVFTAPLNTLGNGDKLNGNGGEDSLSVELTGNVSNLVTIEDIDSVSFAVLAGASTVDATNFSGVTEYVSNGVGALTLNNLNGTAATLVKEGNNSALNANYVTSSVAGGADTANIELKGSTGGLITLGAGVENVVVNSASGDTSVAQLTTGAGATSLTVKGGGTVTLDNATTPIATTFTTIDARDTAAVTLNAAAPTAATSYLTGAGDDSLTINGDIGTAANLISMDGGDDTLTLNAAQTADTASTLAKLRDTHLLDDPPLHCHTQATVIRGCPAGGEMDLVVNGEATTKGHPLT